MNQKLDQELCNKYPKIFANRYGAMTETCMCWGFECGDGWYTLLDTLCASIQHHIDWRANDREHVIEFNEMVAAGLAGDLTLLRDSFKTSPDTDRIIQEVLARGPRKVPDIVPQVVADQVKEKFGGLRFFYTGGDDTIDGMVKFAESLSERTCEACGAPGHSRGGGWITTLCDLHAAERELVSEEKF